MKKALFLISLLGLLCGTVWATVNVKIANTQKAWSFKTTSDGQLLLWCADYQFRDANGSIKSMTVNEKTALIREEDAVRIQIFNTQPHVSKISGKMVVRPILLVDGINLKADPKTLKMFEDELEGTEDPGMPEKRFVISNLEALGYSPILVQFGATTIRSLESNAQTFSKLLAFLAENAFLGWQNSTTQKFQIIGFSQGGVVGRYGAYLYDQTRGTKPGIRQLLTMDSPHQGAVLPRSLLASVDFWVRFRGEGGDEGKSYLDLLQAPGAKDLLIYNTEMSSKESTPSEFAPDVGTTRWLLKEYRNAAEYKGFPVVMVSNGLLAGHRNYPETVSFYNLKRYANWAGDDGEKDAYGSATSNASYSTSESDEYAFNKTYKWNTNSPPGWTRKGNTSWDLVQGSVGPFNELIYNMYHSAFYNKMQNSWEEDIGGGPLAPDPDMEGHWGAQSLNNKNSTFVPTVSALDMKCAGDLAVRKDCAFNKTEAGINWEIPGSALTTAKAIFAIDASHAKYNATSGIRHVTGADPLDYWRVFCSIMKSDVENGQFQNPALIGQMQPTQSCMDQSSIPQWFLSKYDVTKRYKFPYTQWAYNSASNGRESAIFTVPGGWNPVATFNSKRVLTGTDVIEVTVRVPKTFGWFKLDFVLTGGGWLQLGEQTAIRDGASHTYTWSVPSYVDFSGKYKGGKLIMNSGTSGEVEVRSVRIAPNPTGVDPVRTGVPMTEAPLYPEYSSQWHFGTWGDHDMNYRDALGTGLKLNFPNFADGAVWYTPEPVKTGAYTKLVVKYWPNTCRNTLVYFDQRSFWQKVGGSTTEQDNFSRLVEGHAVVGNMWQKTIPLSAIDGVDGIVSRLVFQSERTPAEFTGGVVLRNSENCIIQSANFAK